MELAIHLHNLARRVFLVVGLDLFDDVLCRTSPGLRIRLMQVTVVDIQTLVFESVFLLLGAVRSMIFKRYAGAVHPTIDINPNAETQPRILH